MTDLHYLSATSALELFRSRSLSPVELLEAIIQRAETVEPTVNALCHRFFEEAMTQAHAAQERYANGHSASLPLDGIPVAVKEEDAVAGQPWTQGSLIFQDAVAERSSTFVQRIVDAGGIVHARTTAPEFSCAGFTQSPLWGITRNPWNPDYSPGGSSGGSGAALASGTTTLASGTDAAGSIRMPASFNGIVGFKPPYGRVPVDPPFNLDSYCHSGPMARTVPDCALFQNVLSGPDPSDIASLRQVVRLPDRSEGVAGMRIALSVDLGSWPVDPEIRKNTLAVADALRSRGAAVEEVDLVVPRDKVFRAAAIHYQSTFGAAMVDAVAEAPELVAPYTRDFLRWMTELADGGSTLEGMMLEADLYRPVGNLLEGYDALICATWGTRGLLADDAYLGYGPEVDGEALPSHLEASLTPVFNVMSQLPVLAMPSGSATNGVPTGVQIVGRTYDDLTPFRIGRAVEADLGFWSLGAQAPLTEVGP